MSLDNYQFKLGFVINANALIYPRKSILAIIILLPLASFFLKCSTKCLCVESQAQTISDSIQECNFNMRSIPIPHIPKVLKKMRANGAFNFSLFTRNEKIYLSYVSTQNELLFVNLSDSNEIYHSKFPFFGGSSKVYLLKFDADTLHMINKTDTLYFKILIDNDFAPSVLNEINLNNIVKIKNWFIHYNFRGNVFDYNYPYLFIPYGIRGPKNLIDSKACLMIDLEKKSFKKIIQFPECYSSCYIDDENVSLAYKYPHVIGVYSYHSEFVNYNIVNNSETKYSIPLSNGFQVYDKEEIRNLAYERKYASSVERNTNLFFLNDGKFVIFKRVQKNDYKEKDRYRFYCYSSDNKLLCSDLFPFSLFNRLTVSSKSGFITINDSLSNVYSYEIK